MDLIAVDIGNSNIKLGAFGQGEIQRTENLAIEQIDKLPGIFQEFREICGPQALGAATVPVVACSVNDGYLKLVQQALVEALNQNILLVGRDFPLEMKVGVEDIATLGSDRMVAAYGAYQVIETAVVVADFGTATTIDCVNDNGIFLGGVIMPGLDLAARSLNDYTAALPVVTPAVPTGNYGTNTEMAIQNGIYYGAIGALREMTDRYATELGRWPQVVVTGGYGNLIAQKCDFIDSVVPDLCLNGLFLAYSRFHETPEAQEMA